MTVLPAPAIRRRGRAVTLFDAVYRYRDVLRATALLELRQRYAGSLLGPLWILLYPLLFLSIYLFLYLVIFKMRFPGYSNLNFVVFVFSGLVPFLVIMESVTRGAQVIRDNLHLIRNVIMPVELVPLRLVMVAFLGQAMSFVLLIGLTVLDGDLSARVVLLPLVLLLAAVFILGVVFFVSSLGALVSDVGYVVNLTMTALMFLSPIAFKPDMVPASLHVIIYLNPLSYVLEAVRWSLIASYAADPIKVAVFPVMAVLVFVAGLAFFGRFKGLMADHV